MAEKQHYSPVLEAYAQDPALPSAAVASTGGLLPVGNSRSTMTAQSVDALLLKILADIEGPSLGSGHSSAVVSARRPRILVGVSGSVATIKLVHIAEALLSFADVVIVTTKSARHFYDEAALPVACQPVLTDEDEWRHWKRVGDPVVHIELRKWADVFLIAPLSANSLAKIANGLCDNLLTCIVRAWDMKKSLIVAPAMNTFMWESPFTEQHLDQCRRLGVKIVPPVNKKLACGDVGVGGMAAAEDIAAACKTAIEAVGFSTAPWPRDPLL